MKRAHGHLAFALVAATLSAVTVGECVRLQHARNINTAVAAWATAPNPDSRTGSSPDQNATRRAFPPAAGSPNPSAVRSQDPSATGSPTPRVVRSRNPTALPIEPQTVPSDDHLPPEAQLAHAVALAKADYDAALAAYKAIIQSSREDLHRIALFDLGNLHLRQAIQYGMADEAQSLPLTELAKQSYRTLLRRDPNDWDARYNLERALRLAPEEDEDANDETGPPDPNEHQRSTIADPRMDLP